MSCTELSSQWLFVMLRMPIPRLQWPGSLLTWASPLSLPSHVTLIRRCQLFIIGLAFWSVWLQSSMMTCIMQSPHWSCNEYNDMCVLLRPVTTFLFQVWIQKICLLCLKACYASLLCILLWKLCNYWQWMLEWSEENLYLYLYESAKPTA